MKQQINLYTPKVSAGRDILSLPSVILMVVLVMLVAAFASWGFTQYADSRLSRLQALQEKNNALPNQIALLESQRKDLHPDPALLQEQDRIRKLIAEKQELFAMLKRMQPGVVERGFSAYLYGLAQVSRSGVWITDFDLHLALSRVELNGIARTASDVPLLLRDLGETDAYQAIRIADFSIAKERKDHKFKVMGFVNTGGSHEP